MSSGIKPSYIYPGCIARANRQMAEKAWAVANPVAARAKIRRGIRRKAKNAPDPVTSVGLYVADLVEGTSIPRDIIMDSVNVACGRLGISADAVVKFTHELLYDPLPDSCCDDNWECYDE